MRDTEFPILHIKIETRKNIQINIRIYYRFSAWVILNLFSPHAVFYSIFSLSFSISLELPTVIINVDIFAVKITLQKGSVKTLLEMVTVWSCVYTVCPYKWSCSVFELTVEIFCHILDYYFFFLSQKAEYVSHAFLPQGPLCQSSGKVVEFLSLVTFRVIWNLNSVRILLGFLLVGFSSIRVLTWSKVTRVGNKCHTL